MFFNDGPLSPQANMERYASLAAEIDAAVVAESARWGDSKTGSPFTRDEHWVRERDRILNDYMPRRTAITLAQMVNDLLYPELSAASFTVNGISQHGGLVSAGDQIGIGAEAGTVYFTTDGADPRQGNATTAQETWVDEHTPLRAFVPEDATLENLWHALDFDDAEWNVGTAGVGYDRGSDYAGLIGLDLLSTDIPASARIDTNSDGINENNSVLIRAPFQVDDPESFDTLDLDITYDDGFVAYLNGRAVARANSPDPVRWNSAALQSRGEAAQVMVAITYASDNSITIYRNGEVYATAADASLGSLATYPAGVSNVLMGLRHNDIVGSTGTATGTDPYLAGTINEARIYGAVLSADDIATLADDGPLIGAESPPVDPRLAHLWSFNTDTSDLIGTAHGTLHGGAVVAGGRLTLDGVDDYLSTASIDNAISAKTLVTWISLDNLTQQAGSALTLQNPTGSDTFDGIVYAERTTGQWMAGSNFFSRTVADNRGAPETLAGGDVLVVERFDLSEHLDVLVPGKNVLAIQGLSHDVEAENMLISPRLTAKQTTSTGVSPTATLYSEPFGISDSTQVKARVFQGGEWSALTQAVFTIPLEGFRTTEIMYHPADRPPPSNVSDNELEFIEFRNVGPVPIDLEKLELTSGVRFDFALGDVASLAPNDYVLVVSNRAEFESLYGANLPVAGQYDGQLANDGERIVVSDRFGNVVQEFSYSDTWYAHTDGDGYSLTLLDENDPLADLNDAASWRPSNRLGGTPGTSDTAVRPGAVIINEVSANTSDPNGNWIELRNTTDQPVAIGHWYLSDDETELQKYQFASDTVVPAGGFLVLNEKDQFGTSGVDAGRLIAFDLAAGGGDLIVTGGDADGHLLGYRHARPYGAAVVDESLGVYTKSTGATDFVRLTHPSRGAVNAPPVVGPVVINEIMYNPPFGSAEFIELHNISQVSVRLDDDAGNAWRLRGAIDVTLPIGQEIPPGGFALLLQVADGANSSFEVAAFRVDNNIPESVNIWTYTDAESGSLSNGGEKIFLDRPQFGINAEPLVYDLVDAVKYDDDPPWTTLADGNGASLSRFQSSTYGNDVANWVAGTVDGTPGRVNSVIDTSPPTAPVGLRSSIVAENEVLLTWGFATDLQSGVEEYRVYRDGQLLTTTPIPLAIDVGSFSMSPVNYHVTAVNSDGFESPGSAAATVAGQVLTFQDGVDGYNGTQDATIQQSQPLVNFGDASSVEIDGNDGGFVKAGLVRWELSGVPRDAIVLGAEISIQVTDPTGGSYDLFPVNRPWNEDEVTWTSASTGVPWQVAGAGGAQDRGSTSLASIGGSTGRRSFALNNEGVALVRNWIAGSEPNYGFVVTGDLVSDGLDFRSREATSVLDRPSFSIVYIASPDTAMVGDINRSGAVDAEDIDLLNAALAHGIDHLIFDLDANGFIDDGDLNFLLEDVLLTVMGDANLDGYVDGSDFNLWNDNKFSPGDFGWHQGDFNGDRQVDASDFNLWSENRFTNGGRAMLNDAKRLPRAPLAARIDLAALDHVYSQWLKTAKDRDFPARTIRVGGEWVDDSSSACCRATCKPPQVFRPTRSAPLDS